MLRCVDLRRWMCRLSKNDESTFGDGCVDLRRPMTMEHGCYRTIDLRRSTHQSPIFEGRHIDHRSSKVDASIFEGRHIVTSIFEGRHIDLRSATHRSSKIDTSIIDLRKSTHRSSKIEGGNITPTIQWRRNHGCAGCWRTPMYAC